MLGEQSSAACGWAETSSNGPWPTSEPNGHVVERAKPAVILKQLHAVPSPSLPTYSRVPSPPAAAPSASALLLTSGRARARRSVTCASPRRQTCTRCQTSSSPTRARKRILSPIDSRPEPWCGTSATATLRRPSTRPPAVQFGMQQTD